MLGSIAANFIGEEPQAAHCGPWFCLSNMAMTLSSALAIRLEASLVFFGILWVSQISNNLMDVVALWALKGADIKSQAAGRNARQYRCCLADWT